MKVCPICRRKLPIEEFPLRRKKEIVRHNRCRYCLSVYKREWLQRKRSA